MRIPIAVVSILLVVAMGSVSAGFAQYDTWTPAGPDGARVFAFAIDPANSSTLYLGTFWGGLYRSTDGAATWLPADTGMPNAKIVEIEVSPHDSDVVFAAADGWRLFKSTDGAASWVSSNGSVPPQPSNRAASDIDFHPSDTNVVYWARGASDCAVHKSLDGGATWPCADTGLPDSGCSVVIVNPGTPDTVYADCSYQGVYKTVNGAVSWSESTTGLPTSGTSTREPIIYLTMNPASPDTLYARSNVDGALYKTIDGATTWTQVSTDLLNHGGMWHHPSNGKIFAVKRDDGGASPTYRMNYFESSDSGLTWTNLTTGYFGGNELAIDPANQAVFFAAMSGGLYKSTDSGASWSPVNEGLRGLDIFGIAYAPSAPSTYYLGVPSQTIVRTVDAGLSFTQIHDNIAHPVATAMAVHPSDPQWVLAAAHPPTSWMFAYYEWPHDVGLVWASDGGDTWQSIADPLNPVTGVSMVEIWEIVFDPSTSGTVYAASSDDNRVGSDRRAAVFKSTDSGVTWTHSSTGIPEIQDLWPTALAAVATSPTTLYFGMGPQAGFYKSVDAGASWTEISAGTAIDGLYVTAVTVPASDPSRVFVGTEEAGAFMSPDGGTTWSSISTGLPAAADVSCLLVDPTMPGTLYAGVNDWDNEEGGVYWTADEGANWGPLKTGMGSQTVRALELHPTGYGHLLAGTERSLWEIRHRSGLIFADGFESGDTTQWPVRIP